MAEWFASATASARPPAKSALQERFLLSEPDQKDVVSPDLASA